MLALVIHLIPSAIIVVVLALAWRWEWVGALVFAALAGFYLVITLRHPEYRNWILMISGPLFLIAVLFLISWLKRSELHPRPQGH